MRSCINRDSLPFTSRFFSDADIALSMVYSAILACVGVVLLAAVELWGRAAHGVSTWRIGARCYQRLRGARGPLTNAAVISVLNAVGALLVQSNMFWAVRSPPN